MKMTKIIMIGFLCCSVFIVADVSKKEPVVKAKTKIVNVKSQKKAAPLTLHQFQMVDYDKVAVLMADRLSTIATSFSTVPTGLSFMLANRGYQVLNAGPISGGNGATGLLSADAKPYLIDVDWSKGVKFLLLAFDQNNNLLFNIATKTPSKFYLFIFDALGNSLAPKGLAIEAGRYNNTGQVVTSNAIELFLTPYASPAGLSKAGSVSYPAVAQLTLAVPSSQQLAVAASPAISSQLITMPAGVSLSSLEFTLSFTPAATATSASTSTTLVSTIKLSNSDSNNLSKIAFNAIVDALKLGTNVTLEFMAIANVATGGYDFVITGYVTNNYNQQFVHHTVKSMKDANGNLIPSAAAWSASQVSSIFSDNSSQNLSSIGLNKAINIVASSSKVMTKKALGSLSYKDMKMALQLSGLAFSEVLTSENAPYARNSLVPFSIQCGNLGFPFLHNFWTTSQASIDISKTLKSFNWAAGVTYLMLAFHQDGSLVIDLVNDPFENFYLFVYDVSGKSIVPAGIVVPVTLGTILESTSALNGLYQFGVNSALVRSDKTNKAWTSYPAALTFVA